SLHDELGCDVVGVDLSGVRIDNALDALKQRTTDVRAKVAFEKASATELPFEDETFSHVWSQATLYHVHDQEDALKEAYRVLEDGGIFVFDDLFKPQPNISPSAQKHVYERLLFDTEYSLETYQEELEGIGFNILDAVDLSDHLKMSYWCLSIRTHDRGGEHAEHYEELSYAYEQSAQAVVNREIGWGLFLCQK
ncbi:MAG: methyltransferase domain-containing protein, partial [Dehalococcoidia bacterium]|nr:methyltransferase domain-containing protein [Dehalococcoidia bacterium]